MKYLKYTGERNSMYSLEYLIADSCRAATYVHGELETLENRLEKTQELIGRFAQVLFDKDILSIKDINKILEKEVEITSDGD